MDNKDFEELEKDNDYLVDNDIKELPSEEVIEDNNDFYNQNLNNQIRNIRRQNKENQNTINRLRQRNANTMTKGVEAPKSTPSSSNEEENEEINQSSDKNIGQKISDKAKEKVHQAKETAKKAVKKAVKSVAKKIALKILSNPYVLAIIGVCILIMLVPIFWAAFDNNSSTSSSSTNISAKYQVNGMPYSGENMYISLRECSDISTPVAGEELVPLEKYILGVTYQENYSNEAAAKSEAIAARSYTLTRHVVMGAKFNYYMEGGKIIIPMRACTNEQAYCDPDKGCWSDKRGGEGATIHSGQQSGKVFSKAPLAEDSELRTWVAETNGVVLVDFDGNVVYTPYYNAHGNKCVEGNCMAHSHATQMGTAGKDYKEIIMLEYNGVSNNYTLTSPVLNKSTSNNSYSNDEAESWTQCDSRWGSYPLGLQGGTVCKIGCALTSLSIQIARSGVSTTLDDFNTGTFIKEFDRLGNITKTYEKKGCDGCTIWDVTQVAPNFKYETQYYLYGTKEEKVNQLNKIVTDGKMAVIGVRYNVQTAVISNPHMDHYVAFNYAEGNKIYDFDPASKNKAQEVFTDYSAVANSGTAIRVILYNVGG